MRGSYVFVADSLVGQVVIRMTVKPELFGGAEASAASSCVGAHVPKSDVRAMLWVRDILSYLLDA